jgi:hypothetical protein
MTSKLGLLVFVGSIGLMACGANKPMRDAGEGEPCFVERQKSACAKDGYPAACGPCQGHWLVCVDGTWHPFDCEPMWPDAAVDRGSPVDGLSSEVRHASDAPMDTWSKSDTSVLDPIDAPADSARAFLDAGDSRTATDTAIIDTRDAAADTSDTPRDSADSRIDTDAPSTDGRDDSADSSS